MQVLALQIGPPEEGLHGGIHALAAGGAAQFGLGQAWLAGNRPHHAVAHEIASVVDIAVERGERPHHTAIHVPRLELIPERGVFRFFGQLFRLGNRQQIEQRADVVREEPAGLLEGGQRAGFVATFHLHAADVVGHLGGQPQQILPEAGRRIAVSQVERGPLFHFRPERFLAFHQRGQINILLHDLGAVEHAVGLQIAVLAQRVGKVNGGQPAQVFIGGNEFLHEGGKTDLQQRLLALAVESQREILAVELGVGVAQRHHMHR